MVVGAVVLAACGAPITIPQLKTEELKHFQHLANFPHLGYRIEAGDALQIRYTYHPEMNQDVSVQPDGKITAMLVGELSVHGMSIGELEALLAQRTADRLRNPEVVVSIARFSEKTVYIGGEVGKPGILPYRRGLTPLQAIIASGGFKDTARLESVILVRGGPEDRFMARTLNLAQVVQDGAREPVYLAPHDIVFVPRTPIADANLWVRQHITDLIPFFRGSTLPLPVQ
jgi:protein involved in polysaccharide export with SLBB domain